MDLEGYLRRIPDFPRPGITFIDIMPLVADGGALRRAVEELRRVVAPLGAQRVVAPEARGFLVGAPLALALGVGFTAARKPGHLPAARLRASYQLEYGEDALEMHRDGVRPGERVVVVDDLLATGGTVRAAIELVERLGGSVVGTAFLVELIDLGGRDGLLAGYPVHSLMRLREVEPAR